MKIHHTYRIVKTCFGSKSASCKTGSEHRLNIATPLDPKADGCPVKLKECTSVKIPSWTTAGTKLYSLVYMSQGRKVQGYVSLPPGAESNPLLLNLHGGYQLPVRFHNYGFPAYSSKSASISIINGAVNLFPNYRGYGSSRGTIGDGYDCYIDTLNGIKALSQINGLNLQFDTTYIIGFSLGSLVAMKIAEHDKSVKAAVLISPTPGIIPWISWVRSQERSDLNRTQLKYMRYYESFAGKGLQSSWHQRNSFQYSNIHIPVLIIGGNDDPIIPRGLLNQMHKDLSAHDPMFAFSFIQAVMPQIHTP